MSYLGNIFINYALRQTATPTPPAGWLGLVTASGEVLGGAYARVAVSGQWAPPTTTDTTYNLNKITFPQSTSDWGTVLGVVLYDAASGGNILMGATFATPVNVPALTEMYFNPGGLKFEAAVKVS